MHEERVMTKDGEACELCGRIVAERTRHHLIPQTRHHNKKNKKHFSRMDVKTRVAWLCRPCHKHVHTVLDNKTLEYSYNTLEALAAHPAIHRFTTWLQDKPDGTTVTTCRKRSA